MTCLRCDGEGFIVTCIDDMCRGAGECIHGYGETVCPECDGEGEIFIRDDEYGDAGL
jgi:hypothetical protein